MKNTLKQEVCIIANKYIKEKLSRSIAFIKAWALIKTRTLLTKVVGVTQGISQKALHKLATCYNSEDIIVSLQREPLNLYDSNAIEVLAGVKNKGIVKIGYLPRPLANLLAPILGYGYRGKSVI